MVSVRGLVRSAGKAISSVPNYFGWGQGYGRVFEAFPGAWQGNLVKDSVGKEQFHAVFACVTLIAGDIAKLPINVVSHNEETGIWKVDRKSELNKIVLKPNHYQNRIQFVDNWLTSKLLTGNTYALKVRSASDATKIEQLRILDPKLVHPLVSDDGQVFYQLGADNLNGMGNGTTVPASEIIHDRFNCFYHPLVGLSPIFAAALAVDQGVSIQRNSVKLFQNGGQTPGIITAPGKISKEDAARIKEYWESNYTGSANVGKVAVLGDGLEYKSASLSNVDLELIDQLRWTAEVVCSVFHVPPHKIGVGDFPSISDVQALNVQYYSQCLQVLIEAMEALLDEAVEADYTTGYEFDIEALLRMDGTALATYLNTLTKGSIMTVNEARAKLGLSAVPGGDSIYMQQQNFSLEALVKRDAKENPFETSGSSTQSTAQETHAPVREAEEDEVDDVTGDIMGKWLTSYINNEVRRTNTNG